ncbi:MAG: PIN domain-containing protein [Defluviitaleaceae bacterium]|nr:PIN domain-containing protein [Defluviitaleaceae bacterium]
MKKNYILDACALIAAIKQENGALVVAELYEEAIKGELNIIINKVNLLEVYYGFRREHGKEYAEIILKSVVDSVVKVSDISMDVLIEAGKIKSDYRRISLADSIALAEASVSGGYVVTADHHEMDVLDKAGVVKFLWIR